MIAYLILKFTSLRKIFDGKESVIIYKGKVNIEEMKKLCYNFDDLISQLRQKNIRCIEEVEYAILENSGKLSVFQYTDNDIFPVPIITAGRVEKSYFKLLGIDMQWIEKELQKQNTKLQNVSCAYYKNGELIVFCFN